MNELNTGELADEMGLTFSAFWKRLNRVGARDPRGIASLENFVSEECLDDARLEEQKRMAGMTGKVGSEA